MRVSAILAIILVICSQTTYAQTVSILSFTADNETAFVEAAMKRQLRAEGYTVKSDTNEGIVLMLSVVPSENRAGRLLGLAGHVTVVSVNWQNFADLAVAEPCKEDHATAQKITDYLGIRVVFHTSQMAIASDAERLAEMLITGKVNGSIRDTARKMQAFFDGINAQRTEESRDVINPVR